MDVATGVADAPSSEGGPPGAGGTCVSWERVAFIVTSGLRPPRPAGQAAAIQRLPGTRMPPASADTARRLLHPPLSWMLRGEPGKRPVPGPFTVCFPVQKDSTGPQPWILGAFPGGFSVLWWVEVGKTCVPAERLHRGAASDRPQAGSCTSSSPRTSPPSGHSLELPPSSACGLGPGLSGRPCWAAADVWTWVSSRFLAGLGRTVCSLSSTWTRPRPVAGAPPSALVPATPGPGLSE